MRKPTAGQVLFLFAFTMFSLTAISQTEYRITEEGKYQYLSIKEEANMIYDESMGTYYKPITLRTFYLETYKKGYMPKELSYTQFAKLSIDEQRAIVNQPHRDIECSVNNPSPECMAMEENEKLEVSKSAKVIDLAPKCGVKDAKATQKNTSWTTKLLMNPNDENLENIDCGDVAVESGTVRTEATGKKAPSTMNILLGVEQ